MTRLLGLHYNILSMFHVSWLMQNVQLVIVPSYLILGPFRPLASGRAGRHSPSVCATDRPERSQANNNPLLTVEILFECAVSS